AGREAGQAADHGVLVGADVRHRLVDDLQHGGLRGHLDALGTRLRRRLPLRGIDRATRVEHQCDAFGALVSGHLAADRVEVRHVPRWADLLTGGDREAQAVDGAVLGHRGPDAFHGKGPLTLYEVVVPP